MYTFRNAGKYVPTEEGKRLQEERDEARREWLKKNPVKQTGTRCACCGRNFTPFHDASWLIYCRSCYHGK